MTTYQLLLLEKKITGCTVHSEPEPTQISVSNINPQIFHNVRAHRDTQHVTLRHLKRRQKEALRNAKCLCLSVYFLRLSVAESPVRFLREAPKIYEMCLHVLLDVEVGLRESKGWLGEGALGQWKPSPLLGSALVGANKKGASVCKYADTSKGGESYFVEVCSKLGCHLPNDLVGWENGRMIVPYIVSRAAADRTLAPQRPRFQIIESRQKSDTATSRNSNNNSNNSGLHACVRAAEATEPV
ncbi:hypothetical protein DPX16_18649 [Anabarilius grahami]|uniref:Uncharacterized protein n=1 Tax=Anabarilius grahami TaxID=495550 RepID=A0A3N0YPB1_ANAGA|nr:hypothetical protein DPX16_18649 [Anabarilius grahami]